MDLLKFKNPPKEYRTAPFWSWNDELAEEELRRQIREMKEQGFGGFFMHSREGLRTPYLTDTWFERVSAAAAEAENQGMDAWMYDEDRWPSGCAGGIVTASSDEYKAKWLVMMPSSAAAIADALNDPNTAAVFCLEFDPGGSLIRFERIGRSDQITHQAENNDKITYCQFQIQVQRPTSNSNGHGYIDVFNPEAVQEFIKVTHERYLNRVGEYFGSVIPGIFTDEPTYRSKADNSIPWSPYIPEYFSSHHGYDLMNHLPELFFESVESAKIRSDFYYTLTKAFVENFTKRIYDWCDKHGLMATGHLLSEDTLVKQTNAVGAAMPHYQYMHVPGIDHLGNNTANALTLKQCASVGNQFGRRRMLCEIFGVSGHHMTFADQQWIANYHFALGITFLSQHLVLYSMTGERKRDYPPTFSYHQPYWPYYRLINDYLARAGYFCQQGDYFCDTLVLHPIGSVWAEFNREGGRPLPSKYDAELIKLQDALFQAQIPFDYGDELIMEEHAEVVVEAGRAYLQINKAKYRTVIVPPSLTWRAGTFELLKRFVAAGGRLMFVGETPSLIGGEPDRSSWKGLLADADFLADDCHELIDRLGQICLRPIQVETKTGEDISHVIFQVRTNGDAYYCFIANLSREKTHELIVTAPKGRYVYSLDFASGKAAQVEYTALGEKLQFELTLAPAGGRGFLITDEALTAGKPQLSLGKDQSVIWTADQWNYRLTHKNSLTLDYCRFAAEEGNYSEKVPVWQVRRALWKAAGLDPLRGLQPWAALERNLDLKRIPIKLIFEFMVEKLPAELGLVIENSHHWQLKVNGRTVSTKTDRYYWDRQFGLVDICEHAAVGRNIIELSGEFYYGVELEEIYLVGDFALRQTGYNSYAVTGKPERLANGSWVYQGYPFYAGNIVYETEFNLDDYAQDTRYLLQLNNPRGTLFRVKVNGRQWHNLISEPWVVDVSGDLNQGGNLVQIEVVGSLRNTFGPLHHRLQSPAWCGPNQFVDAANWIDSYQFEDYGLIDGVSLVMVR